MSKQLLHGCLYLLCTLSLFVSCKKNPDANSNVFPGSSFPIPASTPVQGTLSGRVVDENNAPVASAVVECAGISVVSNADGFFNINNATLDKYVSTVIVSKAGYFKGYRSFSASPTRNFVSIKLIPRILSGTFDGTSGGIITLSNGTKIDFLPNGMIIKSSGAVYNGTVNVFAAYIDPTSDDISSKVPGSFMGRDGTNLYSLQSAGMLAVDIESVSGEVLQLAANKPASVKLPIPNSIVGKAPSNIDTWSLDEQGVWKKEAIAVKSGDHYEFSATHFSFWNVDVPNNAVYLSLHLQDNSGHSLVNTSVSLTISPNNSWPSTTYGITDELGNVSGMVPAGYELQLQIFPGMNVYACTTPLYSQGLGMFTENTSLTVTATLSSQQFQENIITVTGIANDCSGLPLQSGTVFIQSGNHYTYASVTNGSYSTLLAHCDAVPSITISISDNNTTAIAAPVIVTTTGNTAVVPLVTLTCGLTLNPLDGIYEISGSFVDASNPAFVVQYPRAYHLITNGPFSVVVAQTINGTIDPGILFFNGTGGSFYGNFGIQATFDLTTNLFTELHNYYGDPVNPPTQVGDPALGSGAPNYISGGVSLRSASLDPTGFNDYDPATRVIRIKYLMYQSTYSPGPRCTFDETWTYIGPR